MRNSRKFSDAKISRYTVIVYGIEVTKNQWLKKSKLQLALSASEVSRTFICLKYKSVIK